MPTKPADHPRQLQGGVAAREGAGVGADRDVGLDRRVEGHLGEVLHQAGGQAEHDQRDAARRRPPRSTTIATSAKQRDDHHDRRVDLLGQRGDDDAERVAETGGADHQADQQRRACLPALDRVRSRSTNVMNIVRKPGQQPRAAVGAQREGDRRRDAGARRWARRLATAARSAPRPRWSRPSPAAGSRRRCRARTPGRRSAAPTPGRSTAAKPASGAETAAPTTPASETRPLAFTRVISGGSSRGTAAAG